MKIKQKHSPTYVLSLSEEEALLLKEYLNHTDVRSDLCNDHQRLNEFGWELWNELDELINDKPKVSADF